MQFCSTWALHASPRSRRAGLSSRARTKDEVLLKLNLLSGSSLTLRDDGDSLRTHNKHIGWDQTDGDLECNEPPP